MKDPKRQEVIDKINWYKSAIANSKSPYLKRDYQKAIKHLQKELKLYDFFQHQSASNQ